MEFNDILPAGLYTSIDNSGDINIIYTSNNSIVELLKFLKDNQDFGYKILTDLFAVDYLGQEKRWQVIYNLLNIDKNKRLIVKLNLSEDESVESVTSLYSAANWYEREIWDMYGIEFLNHPDMRRILTDYGFKGHPLRKDFPLTGYEEVRYDYDEKKVIYEPVKLPQEFRRFDFLSPWEGPSYILPGDEKAKS